MPVRLAIVIPGFQSSESDWCIPVFTNLARELARSAEVHVFALRYPTRRDTYRVGAVAVHSFGAGALAGVRVPALSITRLWLDFLGTIRSVHSRTPFDAVLGIWATESGWLASVAARAIGIPSIVHFAGGETAWIPAIRYGNLGQGLAGSMIRRSVANATLLTIPSLPVKQTLMREFPRVAAKLRDWAPGVDTHLFHPAHESPGTGSGETRFITVGSLVPVKGHDWLLRSLAELLRRRPAAKVRLVFAGDGPLRAPLEELVHRLRLERHVSFLGEVPHDRLPDLYRASDCFLLGSWHEAQCMAVLEAMACGLPWIGPPVGALGDIACRGADAPSGRIVQERTASAMAAAIEHFLDSPAAERQALGEQARRQVEEHYGMESQARKLVRLTVASAFATIYQACL